jgi:nitroreductase
MDFHDLVAGRYSVRAYGPDPVSDADLAMILEAARLAPTAANKQPIRLLAIRTAGRQDDLQLIYHRPWFVAGPLVIGVCTVPAEGWVRKDGKNHADIDAAIVMDHIVMQSTELGYGTCWVCNFDVAAAREVLHLPEGVEPIAFTPLGRPADQARPKVRRDLRDLLLEG